MLSKKLYLFTLLIISYYFSIFASNDKDSYSNKLYRKLSLITKDIIHLRLTYNTFNSIKKNLIIVEYNQENFKKEIEYHNALYNSLYRINSKYNFLNNEDKKRIKTITDYLDIYV